MRLRNRFPIFGPATPLLRRGQRLPVAAFMVFLLPSLVLAQHARNEEGFEIGSIRIRPVAEVLGAYDNRVYSDTTGDDGDFYSELSASLYLENKPAMFDFSADAGYGYRYYQDYTGLDNDFYEAGASVVSSDRPLKLGISSYLKKTLNYDTIYGSFPGQEPGAILTRDPSTRYTTVANVAYEGRLTDRTTIMPGYDVWHYFQDFEDREDAEWQVHRASLQMGYGLTDKSKMFVEGSYSLQANDKEDGTIASVTAGMEGKASEKTSWLGYIGVAAADYEQSGADEGVVGLLRANWNATEKLSTYIYGSSNFQPGYGGGDARKTYRLGYGAIWRITARWDARLQILHDYQEELGNSGNGEWKNFATAGTEYNLTSGLAIAARIRYTVEEDEPDQTVTSLSAIYRY